jgi:hypothetical protein
LGDLLRGWPQGIDSRARGIELRVGSGLALPLHEAYRSPKLIKNNQFHFRHDPDTFDNGQISEAAKPTLVTPSSEPWPARPSGPQWTSHTFKMMASDLSAVGPRL